MTEREVLEHLRQRLATQGQPFKEFPRPQGFDLGNIFGINSYVLNDAGQVIELIFKFVELQDAVPISDLRHLICLHVSNNQLTDVTPLAGLTQLKELDLSNNQLTDVTPLAGLMQLKELNLSNNQLTDVTPLAGLTQLTKLNVSNNQISTFPEAFLDREIEVVWEQWYFSKGINLYNNPLTTPPPEIVKEGNDAIREYFRQQREAGQDSLYEAKLLIIGEPGAGKTTFAQKMLNAAYQLQPEEISTKGIDVLQWEFPCVGAGSEPAPTTTTRSFRVNIWDFGGQEIYKATHQFFLTKRSLYILVADSRKEDTDFYYWLNIVSLLSDDSPVIILKNEKQDRVRELPERQLRAEFTNLKETLPANLATNRGLETVMDTVRHYLTHLPHVGSVLPKTWVNVRTALEQDARNYIPVEEYYRICEQHKFTRRGDQLQLSGYLHDLGVCLHFQDDDLLRKTVILKPEWGTAAVYKVLDNPTVIRHLGCFTKDDLKQIWHDDDYADMRGELLQLMMKFQLCYEIPGRPGRYIAPQLLSENPPDYVWDTHPQPLPEGENMDLRVRYAYEFMPKGMLTRFIVATHPFIEDQKLVWKSGVILRKEGARAEIIEYYGKREMHIRVSGTHKKELLTVVMYEFEKIHGVYSRLKYDTLIPCNCAACKGNAEPHFYKYQVLRKFMADRQETIQCQASYQMVNVRGLLDEVIDHKLSDSFKESDSYGGEAHFHSPTHQTMVQAKTVIIQQGEKPMTTNNQFNNQFQNLNGDLIQGSEHFTTGAKTYNLQTPQDLTALLAELQKMIAASPLPDDVKEDIAPYVKIAENQAKKENPDKKKTVDALDNAKAILMKIGETVPQAVTLGQLLGKAIEYVGQWL